MNKADQECIEEYKPIAIHSEYRIDASEQDKVIYCLANTRTATLEAVAHKIHEYEPTQALQQIKNINSEF